MSTPAGRDNRHVVVTGAGGFVGSHLVDTLLARGDTVTGIDCFTPYYDPEAKRANLTAALANPAFTLVEADLRETDLTAVLVEDVAAAQWMIGGEEVDRELGPCGAQPEPHPLLGEGRPTVPAAVDVESHGRGLIW
mgnify:CR=1 FL=1